MSRTKLDLMDYGYQVDMNVEDIPSSESSQEELFDSSVLSDNIDIILENLSDREQYIIRERYGLNQYTGYTDSRSLHDIGFDEGISQERVRQILVRCEQRLRSSYGFDSSEIRNLLRGMREYHTNMEG